MPPVPSERTTAPTVRQMSSEHAPILRPCVGHGKKGYPTREPVTRRSPRGNLKRVTVCGESHINGFLDTGSIPVGSTKQQRTPQSGCPLLFSDRMEGIERVRSERQHSALFERTLTERAVRARAIPVGSVKNSREFCSREFLLFHFSLFTFHSTRARRMLKEGVTGKRAIPVGRDRINHPISGCPCIFCQRLQRDRPRGKFPAGAMRL